MIGEFGNVKAVAGAIAAGGFHLQNPQYAVDATSATYGAELG